MKKLDPRPSALPAVLLVVLAAACADAPVALEPDLGLHVHHVPEARSDGVSASQNRINAAIRQATARYQQLEVALADGYAQASECVPGMGFHFLSAALLDGVLEPTRPEILVYEPQPNGRLRLVAVEFMVPAAAWDPFNSGPPMLGSRELDDHRAPGSGGPPFPHYQLHAWVWKHNPAGIYTPFNPNSSCEFASEVTL
jgi:hypothetical protein